MFFQWKRVIIFSKNRTFHPEISNFTTRFNRIKPQLVTIQPQLLQIVIKTKPSFTQTSYSGFKKCGLAPKLGHFWGFWREIFGKKKDFFTIAFPARPTFYGAILKNRFFAENFTPKTSKKAKFPPQTKILEPIVTNCDANKLL